MTLIRWVFPGSRFHKSIQLLGIAAATCLCLAGPASAGSCARDGEDYRSLAEQSIIAGDLAQSRNRLALANENGCATPVEYIRLGEAMMAQSAFADAMEAFYSAEAQTQDADIQALAIGRYAQAQVMLKGNNTESLDMIQLARRQHSATPAWMTELALQLDIALQNEGVSTERFRSFTRSDMGRLSMASITPLPKNPDLGAAAGAGVAAGEGSVTTASSRAQVGGSGSPVIERSLSFRVNFSRGSAELEPDQIARVTELAVGLANAELQNNSFKLVGHTDVVGAATMNQRLSERRAAAVYELVVAMQPALKDRLTHSGRGEELLLYPNARSSDEHRLNRRVQVVVR